MQTVLGWILAPLKWLGGLLLPIFTRPKIPPAVFWVLHILVIAAIFAGLYYLHHHSPWRETINRQMPRQAAWLNEYYLLIFAGLIYVFAWVVHLMWKIWLEDDLGGGEFPDLDEAWSEIQSALHQNGIRIDDAPLFLVLGNAELPLDRLFKGLPRESTLTGVTSGNAPLRVFGGRDGLYLACPGVSLLSKALGFGPPDAGSAGEGAGPALDPTKTIGAEYDLTKSVGAGAEEVARIMRAVQREGRGVSDEERHQIRNLSMGDADTGGSRTLRPNVVQSPEVVSMQEARLAYFCRLLAKARTPYCPVNGAILLFSLSASHNEGDSQKLALASQKDLKVVHDVLRLQFPIFVMLADLEKWSGAGAFLARFPEDRRKNRLGRGFPLVPDLSAEQVGLSIQTEVQWVFEKLVPFWCMRFFRLETPNIESPEEAVQINAELFRFLSESQQRAGCIARMVAKAVQPDDETLPSLGGCYVVAQSGGAPWFTNDLFSKVEGSQSYVSWTQQAFDEDADYKAWTWYGYVALLVVWLAVGALGYLWYTRAPSN